MSETTFRVLAQEGPANLVSAAEEAPSLVPSIWSSPSLQIDNDFIFDIEMEEQVGWSSCNILISWWNGLQAWNPSWRSLGMGEVFVCSASFGASLAQEPPFVTQKLLRSEESSVASATEATFDQFQPSGIRSYSTGNLLAGSCWFAEIKGKSLAKRGWGKLAASRHLCHDCCRTQKTFD